MFQNYFSTKVRAIQFIALRTTMIKYLDQVKKLSKTKMKSLVMYIKTPNTK